MGKFIFDNHDFGIDEDRSNWSIQNGILSIEIRGDDSRVDAIDEDSEISSLLYAPYFYARGLPVEERCEIEVTEDILDEYDVAMYALEHYDVLPCSINLGPKGLRIEGIMEQGGFDYPIRFEITDERTDLNAG